MEHRVVDALVIGAGPAGLMAADRLGAGGVRVLVADAQPTFGRKFLMAGKSGLNLTNTLPEAEFLAGYRDAEWLMPALRAFGPAQVQEWAVGLGQELFAGSSGKVFPVTMKASPLLRAWLARQDKAGVERRTRWRWTGWEDRLARFDTPEGVVLVQAAVTVLALGGASWPRLGSDGGWVPVLAGEGTAISPLCASNMGFGVAWSAHMAPHFGAPVKPVELRCGGKRIRGEFVLTAKGIEGSAVYALADELVRGGVLDLDLMPDQEAAAMAGRLQAARPGTSLANRLRKLKGISPVKIALLREFGRLGNDAAIVESLKSLPVAVLGPLPLTGAISTAGGVSAAALDKDLMLKARAGVYCAGEMLDWDAPTGGWLITGCLATGNHAGNAALRAIHAAAAPVQTLTF